MIEVIRMEQGVNFQKKPRKSQLKKKLTRSKYQKQRRKAMRRTRLRPWAFVVLVLIFSSILVANLYFIFDWGKDNKNINDLEKQLEKIVEVVEITDEGEAVNPPDDKNSDYWYYMDVPFYDVDFSQLLKKNPDTVAFINVKGTNINYPIVQTKDNNYYLTHAFDKSYNEAGWVFLDYRNSKGFNDFNTIVYGHGRLNKTVFGSLRNILNKSWQNNKDNYTLTISTPTMNYVYQIFSVYSIESETYYIKTLFKSDGSKTTWINEMNKRNISPIKADANINDKIVTLSTCLNDKGGRVVLHAKLIKQQAKTA